MKPHPLNPLQRLASLALLGALAWNAPAADITWDTSSDPDVQGGDGNWNSTETNWTTDGGGTRVAWTNALFSGDTALFTTNFGRVLLTEGIGLAGLRVTSTESGTLGGRANVGYLFQGAGAMSFGSLNGSFDVTAAGVRNFQVDNNLIGIGGLTVASVGGGTGDGRFILAGDNSGLSGGITVTSGLLGIATNFNLGNNTVTLNGGGLFAPVNRSGPAATEIAASNTLFLANSIVLGTGGNNLVRVWGGRTVTLNGVVAGAGGFQKTDTGTLVLQNGSNTLTGPMFVVGGALQIRDGSNNTATFLTPAALAATSITVSNTGILDLPRLHASTEQIVTYTLPPVSVQDGGTVRFRALTGSSRHEVNGNITVNGNVTFNNNGGAFANNVNLLGTLSGSGAISNLATTASGSSTTTRTTTLTQPNSPFTGNWFVDYTAATSDDFVGLTAGAVGALGTAGVTLDDRAVLNTTVTGGLNSLTNITLLKSTAIANLGSTWNNPAATLVQQDGTVNIAGTGFGSVSVSNYTQSAGVLNLDLGATPASADTITLSGNYDYFGGSMEVALRANPAGNTYTLVNYGGLLNGTPTVNIALPPTRIPSPTVNYGTGSNSAITVAFPAGAVSNLVWQGNNGFNWDLNTTFNFTNLVGGPEVFLTFDNVTFNDTAVNYFVQTLGTIVPGTMVFNHSLNDYTVTGDAISGPGSLTKSGTGTLTLGATNTFTGGVTLNAGRLRAGANNALGSGPITLSGGALSSDSGTPRVLANGPVYNGNVTLGDFSDAGGLNLTGNGSVAASSTVTTLPSGVIHTNAGVLSGGAGATLTKAGDGFLALNGANTYAGGTIINAGRVSAGTGNSFGTGPVTVNDGGQAYLLTSGITVTNPLTVTGLGPVEGIGQLGAIRLGGNTVSGPITLSGDTRITAYNSSGTIAGPIGQTGGSRKLELGGSGLSAHGGNAITISGTNTYTGGTEVRGAIVTANNSAAFGTGPILIDEGAAVGQVTRINLGAGVVLTNEVTMDTTAQTGFLGPLTANGGGLAVVTGPVNINVNVGNGGHFASTGAGSVLRVMGFINSPSVQPNFRVGTNEVGGGGNYTTLQLGEGLLRLAANNGVHTNARLHLAVSNPGQFDLNGYHQLLSQLTRAATATATVLNNGAPGSTLTLNILDTTNNTYGGTFQNGAGGFSLVKTGAGTLTLTNNANTHTGPVTVSQGTLALTGAATLATTNLQLAAGTTLDVLGRTNAAWTLLASQTLGNTGGTAQVNGGLVATNARLALQYTGTPALEIANGTLTLAATTVVTVNNTGGPLGAGSYKLVSIGTGGAVGGTAPTSVAVTGGGLQSGMGAALSLVSDELYLDVAPGGVNTNPTNIVSAFTSSNVTLSWPDSHIGWRLETQTNARSVGLSTNWFTVPGSDATNQVTLPIDRNNPAVFFRLMYP